MNILKREIPEPIITKHAEALSLAVHCFMGDRGYTIFVPADGPQELNEMKLPVSYNLQENEWCFLYTSPQFANYFSMSCGLWGPKLLVTMEEYVKENEENAQFTLRTSYQFGIGQENYAHKEEDLDETGEFGWDILANCSRLHALFTEMVEIFENKLQVASTCTSEIDDSSGGSSSTESSSEDNTGCPSKSVQMEAFIVVSIVVAVGAIVLLITNRK